MNIGQSQIFEQLQQEPLSSLHASPLSSPQQKSPQTSQLLQYITQLEQENLKLKQKLQHHQNFTIRFLSLNSFKLAKKILSMETVIQDKDKQILRLEKILLQNKQKYIIIEGGQENQMKVKLEEESRKQKLTIDRLVQKQREKVAANRIGMEYQSSDQPNKLKKMIEQFNLQEDKKNKQKSKLMQNDKQKQNYSRKQMQEVFEKYLINYVYLISQGKSKNDDEKGQQIEGTQKKEVKVQVNANEKEKEKQEKELNNKDANIEDEKQGQLKNQIKNQQVRNSKQQQNSSKQPQPKQNKQQQQSQQQQQLSQQQQKQHKPIKISKQYLQQQLNTEKLRLIQYIRNFNVVINYEKQEEEKVAQQKWNAFSIISKIFKWK